MKNIIFIGYGILGDFVVCHRSIELLKESYLESQITYVGDEQFAQLGKAFGLVDHVIDESYADFLSFYHSDDFDNPFWNSLFSQADLVVNHKMDANGYFVRNMVRRGFVWREVIGFDTNVKVLLHDDVKNPHQPAAAQVGELLGPLNISTDFWGSSFSVSASLQVKAIEKIDRCFGASCCEIIAFHPGSSTPEKNYPLEKWKAVFEYIMSENENIRLVVFTGPAERQVLSDIKRIFANERTVILEDIDLVEAVLYLSRANCFLGHDTGFAHIAAALKVKALLLFGSMSSKAIWKPPASSTHVLSNSEDINNISEERIVALFNQINEG